MKLLLVIIGFILSCNFGDRASIDEKVCCGLTDGSVTCHIMQDTGTLNLDSNFYGILPSSATGYNGGNNSFTFSHRSPNSGRRIQPNAKFSFLVLKDGALINGHSLYSFRMDLKQFKSGVHSTHRYIHYLCQLLI